MCVPSVSSAHDISSQCDKVSFSSESLCLSVGFIGKPKQKAMGKAVKTPSLTWMEALPPPPPIGELEQCETDEQPPEHEDMDIG